MMLDIRLALRLVRARPRFALAVVLLLAFGIGPNVAILEAIARFTNQMFAVT